MENKLSNTARELVLEAAQSPYLLSTLAWDIYEAMPDPTAEEVRSLCLEMVLPLLRGRFVVVGDLDESIDRVARWPLTPKEALARISKAWGSHTLPSSGENKIAFTIADRGVAWIRRFHHHLERLGYERLNESLVGTLGKIRHRVSAEITGDLMIAAAAGPVSLGDWAVRVGEIFGAASTASDVRAFCLSTIDRLLHEDLVLVGELEESELRQWNLSAAGTVQVLVSRWPQGKELSQLESMAFCGTTFKGAHWVKVYEQLLSELRH